MERNDVLAHIQETYEAGAHLPVCAWCGRVRIDEEWVAPPVGALSTIDEAMTLSHSICPTCVEASPGN